VQDRAIVTTDNKYHLSNDVLASDLEWLRTWLSRSW